MFRALVLGVQNDKSLVAITSLSRPLVLRLIGISRVNRVAGVVGHLGPEDFQAKGSK